MLGRLDLDQAAERTRALMVCGPMAAPGHLRRLGPFVIVAGAAVGSLSFNAGVDMTIAFLMSAVCVAILAADALLPWHRFPRHAQRIPPMVALVGVAVFMYSDGGLESPMLGVIVVPAVWMTMYETLAALYVCMAATSLLLLSELLVDYSADSLLRSLILTTLMLGVFPAAWEIVDQNRRALVALAEVSNTDPLTGLPNRRGFDRRLHDPLDGDDRPLGVVYLDLNGFKGINDHLGHDAGDALLVEVGKRIADTVRSGDVCARFGGDEFVVACRGEEEHLHTVARRVAEAIAVEPFHLGESSVRVSAAVGVSHLADDVLDLPRLMAEADAAMYAAKPSRPR